VPAVGLSRSGRFAMEPAGALEGFAFCGPFDGILQRIGPAWLASVWAELAACLVAHGVDPEVLTWGAWHPTYSSGSADIDYDPPLGVVGWAMPRSGPFLLSNGQAIEQEFPSTCPTPLRAWLHCAGRTRPLG
jgi:hypothetical protein